MSDKRLIVSADDFGIGRKITDVIVDCHRRGIISNTTLMVNMPACEYAVQKAHENPTLGVGIHLTLTQGKPLSKVERIPDIVDEEGNFNSSLVQSKKLWRGNNVYLQVEMEFRAQIERALDLGIKPTHCDSHHGIQKRPLARAALIKLCNEYGIPAARTHRGLYWTAPNASIMVKLRRVFLNTLQFPRVFMRWQNHLILQHNGLKTADRMVAQNFLLPCITDQRKQFMAMLRAIPEGISEIVFHPGCADPDVKDSPTFLNVRYLDAQIAGDPDMLAYLEENRIKLISFKDI